MSQEKINYINNLLKMVTTSCGVFAALIVIGKPHFEQAIDRKLKPIRERLEYIQYFQIESMDDSVREHLSKKWKTMEK